MPIFAPKSAPPDRTVYEALGRLLYSYNALEASLLQSLVVALGNTEEAHIVVAGLSFNQSLDRFSILFNQFLDKQIEGGTSGFCARVAQLTEERNKHIHAHWGFWGSGEPMRAKRKLKRGHGIDVRMEGVKPADIQALASRMDDHTKIVYQAIKELITWRRSQPRVPGIR
jgi:hypothetical protein